jgi:hypothetical protein
MNLDVPGMGTGQPALQISRIIMLVGLRRSPPLEANRLRATAEINYSLSMYMNNKYPALDAEFDHLFARHAELWDLVSKHIRKGETYNVDCNFVAPNKKAANALRNELQQLHKSPVTIRKHEKPGMGFGVEWETIRLELSYETVRSLIVYCYVVANKHGCKFNGWGVLMPVG